MPLYEYRCPGNGQTVEVRHGMSESLATWGELCERSGRDPGDTPVAESVERLISAPVPMPNGSPSTFRGCGSGCGCVREA